MELQPSALDLGIYAVGWSLGWFLLWRLRPLPEAPTAGRPSCAVIIPARNEALAIGDVVGPLVAQRRPGDEIVVVDDHSDDDTTQRAAEVGARVISAPDVPDGWLGKPHACWVGTLATSSPNLLFLDADVRPAPDLIDRISEAMAQSPGSVVSAQPWHATGRLAEQASVMCNITALMGCGAFTALGTRVNTTVAFGPVLAIRRSDYEEFGGHANTTIRRMHTEDIGIARAVGRSQLFTGAPDTTFRMYPGGLRETIRGWTRSIATGARFTPWWLTVATLAWVWSLAGGWFATPLVYPLSALQIWVLGRRAASVHPATALLYPVAVLVFSLIFVRSLIAMVFRQEVTWKGRRVGAR